MSTPLSEHHGEMMRKELSLAATIYHQRESSELQGAKGR
jgi:hypothetical protein